jgi:hypothetical protein
MKLTINISNNFICAWVSYEILALKTIKLVDKSTSECVRKSKFEFTQDFWYFDLKLENGGRLMPFNLAGSQYL